MKKLLLATAAAALIAAPAAAAPVAGQLSMFGEVQAIGGDGNVANATGLDFIGDQFGIGGSTQTGDFTSIFASCSLMSPCIGSIMDIPDFTTFGDVANFFSITVDGITVAFDLDTIGTIDRGTNNLAVNGTGIFHVTGDDSGLEDSLGTFVLTTQASGRVTFSMTALATGEGGGGEEVPEPAALGLLGLGILGLAAARRRKA